MRAKYGPTKPETPAEQMAPIDGETLRVADAETGVVRDVLEETSPTFLESGYGGPNWRYLPQSNEVIWYSQRDDWGHLYLYSADGQSVTRITQGQWLVRSLLERDPGQYVLSAAVTSLTLGAWTALYYGINYYLLLEEETALRRKLVNIVPV